MTPTLKFSLLFISGCCAFACGGTASDDDESQGGTGAGPQAGGTHQSGGMGGEGGDGNGGSSPSDGGSSSDGGSGTGARDGSGGRGGSPNPDEKPDPVDDYPCYGQSATYPVNDAGETAEQPSATARFSYDEQGNEIERLTDDDADGTFDTGSSSEYDSSGRLTTFEYDNDGDTMIDSRAVYDYDAKGRTASIDYFSPVDMLISYYTFEYDNERLLQKTEFRASDDFELRNESYAWSSSWEYDYVQIRGGELREVSHVVLNEYGDALSREVWKDEEKTIWVSKTTTSYDDWGRPVSEKWESDAVVRVTSSTYGDNGLLSQREVREDDELTQVIEYVYFEECMD